VCNELVPRRLCLAAASEASSADTPIFESVAPIGAKDQTCPAVNKGRSKPEVPCGVSRTEGRKSGWRRVASDTTAAIRPS